MENKSDLKGVLLGVFLVISLLLGAFIVYDKLLKKEETKGTTNTNCQCEKCEVCENKICNCANSKLCKTSNKYSDQLIFSSIGMFFVTSKGEVYYEPRYNTSDESFNESDIKNAAKKLLGNPGKYTVTSDSFIEGNKHVFDYKLNLSNIRYGIELSFGNGGFNSTIAFVSTDGTISEISYGDEKMLFYKNVSGFSDIVAIVPYAEEEGSSAITYDTCGNSKVYISPRFN